MRKTAQAASYGSARSFARSVPSPARRPEGIFINPFERGEIGPDLFRAACDMGLEGLVSKRRDRPYQAGRSKRWVKVKNRKHPAMDRVMGSFR
jgi:bifunctional non-homologous end joining protein LigD